MERGLYTAATGMVAQQKREETLAHNLANLSTVAFKQDASVFQELQGMALQRMVDGSGAGAPVGVLGTGVQEDQPGVDWRQGSIAHTGRPLDISLQGNEMLVIGAPGGVALTRAGNLQLDAKGDLVTPDGMPLLNLKNKPVKTPGGDVSIDGAGNVVAGGKVVDRLKIVNASPAGLTPAGGGVFLAPNAATLPPVTRPSVVPQALEQSNVSAVESLVALLAVTQDFELAQKAIATHDELLKYATTDLGKV